LLHGGRRHRRLRLGYGSHLLTDGSNRHLSHRGSFGFCSIGGGLRFGSGNRFDDIRGSRLWLGYGYEYGLRPRNNLTLSLRGGGSRLFYWYRPLDSSSIHVRRRLWLRFGHGRRSWFFNFNDSSGIRIKMYWHVRRVLLLRIGLGRRSDSSMDGFLGNLIWRDLV
jgi:hypothetical protein